MPISALISGILAGASQAHTNQSNEDIARETNAQNYKIWQESMAHDKEMFDYENQANIDMFNLQNQANIDMANLQNQWQIDQWNRENEYNSAINQRKRLEEAGLNPYLMMNGGSAGTASSVKSAPFQTGNLSTATMNKSQAPTMQGYQVQSAGVIAGQMALQTLTALSNSIATLDANNRANELQPYYVDKAQGEGYMTKEMANIMKKYGIKNAEIDYRRNWLQYDTDYRNNAILAETQSDIIANVKAMRSLSELDVQSKQIYNKYLDGNQQLDLATKIQNLSIMAVQEKLSWKQIDYYSSMIASNYADVAMKNFDLQFKKDTRNITIEGMQADVTGKNIDNNIRKQEYERIKRTTEDWINKEIMSYKMQYFKDANEYSIDSTVQGAYNIPVFGDLLMGIGGATNYLGKNIGNILPILNGWKN